MRDRLAVELQFFVTITGPGADVLPWDTSRCRHSLEWRCSGKLGCRVQAGPSALWHESKGLRFTHFVRDLRRAVGDVQYFRGVEPQQREVLHDHLVVRCAADLVRLQHTVEELALKHGFGIVHIRRARPEDANYIAKYSTDASDERANVAWPDRSTGEIVRGARCRAWTATWGWGLTMKELRAHQRAWVRERAAEWADGVEARQGDDGRPLPGAQTPRLRALDIYTESYPRPPAEGVSCAM